MVEMKNPNISISRQCELLALNRSSYDLHLMRLIDEQYTKGLKDKRKQPEKDIEISMDSRGRVFDNIFTEKLWRTLKYEEVYIKDYRDVREAKEGIESYFKFYNNERPHQSLGYKTSYEVYYGL